MTTKRPFHVIDGTPKVTAGQRRARMPHPEHMITCHRCGGREVIETKIGMVYRNNRAVGGTKAVLCATCLMQGERVVLA